MTGNLVASSISKTKHCWRRGKSSSMHRQPDSQTDGFRPKQCGRKEGRHIYTTEYNDDDDEGEKECHPDKKRPRRRRAEIPNKQRRLCGVHARYARASIARTRGNGLLTQLAWLPGLPGRMMRYIGISKNKRVPPIHNR